MREGLPADKAAGNEAANEAIMGERPGRSLPKPRAGVEREGASLQRAQGLAHPTHRSLKGRGVDSNRDGRFETQTSDAFDDGWSLDEEIAPLATEVAHENARSVISYNRSPDISFDRSINPYRGCEHGCVYCYARPSHAYLGLSPGLDFESRLSAKQNAPELLRQEFSARNYQPQTLILGANTDCYQPIEKRYALTRQILQICLEFRHPVGIITKSALVLRDLDLLKALAAANLARVAISVTSLDRHLSRIMEPRASAPHRRIQVISQLAELGIPTTVMTAPLIPTLNDVEMEAILKEAARAGANSASYILLRLPLEISDLFTDWLNTHMPDRAQRIMRHVRDMRGGRDYDAQWGQRMKGTGPYAKLLADRFRNACARLGLSLQRTPLDVGGFRVPGRAQQMSLWEDV